jgi:hypothetical protein
MIDFLKRKTAKRQLVTITGTDNHGRLLTEQYEMVTYPRIVNWILRWFVRYPTIKEIRCGDTT